MGNRAGRLTLEVAVVIGLIGCTSSTPTTPPVSIAAPGATSPTGSIALPTNAPTAGLPETSPAATLPAQATASPVPGEDFPPATAAPTPTTAATLAAPPTLAPLIINWNRSAHPGFEGAFDFQDSAASGSDMVLIGRDQDLNSVIWASSNAHDWTVGKVVPFLPGELDVVDVTGTQDGFSATAFQTGSGEGTGIYLTSTDGTSWEWNNSVAPEGWGLDFIASVGATIVMRTDSTTQAGLLTSHDNGHTWGNVNTDDPANRSLLALVGTDDSFWLFAPESSDKQQGLSAWRSTDGDTWTKAGTLPGSLGDTDSEFHVAHGPLGWVATQTYWTRKGEQDYAWWSADGLTWQQAQPAPFGIAAVFADDAGFIATGNYYPNGSGCAVDPAEMVGTTFTSTDGLLWRKVPDNSITSGYVTQLRRYDRTLVGLGFDYARNDEGVGAEWTAKLPALTADSGPVPSIPPLPPSGC